MRLRPSHRGSLAGLAMFGLLAGCATSAGGSPTVGPSPGSRPPVAVSHVATPRLVATARWVREARGYQLRVRPTGYGRLHANATFTRAFRQALAAAAPAPLRLSPLLRQGLDRQLHCHASFAARKATWDIETWRPDLSYLKTVLAECNP